MQTASAVSALWPLNTAPAFFLSEATEQNTTRLFCTAYPYATTVPVPQATRLDLDEAVARAEEVALQLQVQPTSLPHHTRCAHSAGVHTRAAVRRCHWQVREPVVHQTRWMMRLLSSIKGSQPTDATHGAICTDSSYVHPGATGAARGWKVRGWVGSAGTRVSNVTLWEELVVELDKLGRTIVWVEIPSYVGIEGNTQADLLASAGRLASPLYPSRQHGPQQGEQPGEPPPKRRKVEHVLPSHQKQVLLEGDAAILLWSTGLGAMSDYFPGFDDVCTVVLAFSCRTTESLTRLHVLTGVGSTCTAIFGHIHPPALVPSHLQPIIYGCHVYLFCRWPFIFQPTTLQMILSHCVAHERQPKEEVEGVPALQPP